jgi:hypothetical protein
MRRNLLRLLSCALLHAIYAFFATTLVSALTPDGRLTPLIPPDSQMVAGMVAPSHGGLPDSFLIITDGNRIDLQDFFALSGVDTSRLIQQVIFAAGAGAGPSVLSEHSLLVSGQFDGDLIARSAARGGAHTGQYRGTKVLVIEPLERERGTFNDLRWLVFLNSDVAIFGTVDSVKQEIDRHIAKSRPDATILARLSGLRRDDETWCQVAALLPGSEIQEILRMLDPKLANLGKNGGAFQFGIYFGRHVEFEYEILESSGADAQGVSHSLARSPAGPNAKESSLLPRSGNIGVGEPVRGVVKVSRERYEEWQKELSRLEPVPATVSSK